MQLAVPHFDCLQSWDVFTFNVLTNFNNICNLQTLFNRDCYEKINKFANSFINNFEIYFIVTVCNTDYYGYE